MNSVHSCSFILFAKQHALPMEVFQLAETSEIRGRGGAAFGNL